MPTHFNCNTVINCILTGYFEWYRQHKQSFGALPSKRHKPACSKWLSWNCDEQLWMWTSILHLCWSHCREQVIMCYLMQCHNFCCCCKLLLKFYCFELDVLPFFCPSAFYIAWSNCCSFVKELRSLSKYFCLFKY